MWAKDFLHFRIENLPPAASCVGSGNPDDGEIVILPNHPCDAGFPFTFILFHLSYVSLKFLGFGVAESNQSEFRRTHPSLRVHGADSDTVQKLGRDDGAAVGEEFERAF